MTKASDHCHKTKGSLVDGTTYNFQVFMNDSAGNIGLESARSFIENSKPATTTPSLSPATVYTNIDLNCSTTYTDAESDDGTVYFKWFKNNAVIETDSQSSIATGTIVSDILNSANYSKADVIICEIYSNDGYESEAKENSTSKTIANSPIIIKEILTPTITPTAFSTSSVTLGFNATDIDGLSDLSDATSQCKITKAGEATRSNSTCKVTDVGSVSTFGCTIFNYFYDASGSYNINCSIYDTDSNFYSNISETLTINALNRINQNTTTLAFGEVFGDDNEGNSIGFTNGGNQDYTTTSITAYNLSNSTNYITAGNFSVDIDTGQVSGQTYLVEATGTAFSDFTLPKCTSPCSSNSSEQIYFYMDVPITSPLTYTQSKSWSIAIS